MSDFTIHIKHWFRYLLELLVVDHLVLVSSYSVRVTKVARFSNSVLAVS